MRVEELVLLGQSGWSESAIIAHVEQLCNSPTFDDQEQPRQLLHYLVTQALAGRVPEPDDIAVELGKLDFKSGDTFVRTAMLRLRKRMKANYAKKPGKWRLDLPEGGYFVFATRNMDGKGNYDSPPLVSILEPIDNSEVSIRVTVRGRIEGLDPDLRVWLVVLAPDGCYYLQSRISRRSPIFECHTRTGRVVKIKGSHEGAEFVIMLVAADFNSDHDFHRSMKEFEDAYGPQLPPDTQVLASVKVIRRDIHP